MAPAASRHVATARRMPHNDHPACDSCDELHRCEPRARCSAGTLDWESAACNPDQLPALGPGRMQSRLQVRAKNTSAEQASWGYLQGSLTSRTSTDGGT